MAAVPLKPEYPPLLQAGFHKYSLCDFCKTFVVSFQANGSKARSRLMSNFQIIVRDLLNAGIVGEIWIGNSFVTKKTDPTDIDIIVSVEGKFYDTASPDQLKVLDRVRSNLKESLGCDSKLLINYDDDHPAHGDSVWDKTAYLSIFGFYHPDGRHVYERKGVAILSLPGCAP